MTLRLKTSLLLAGAALAAGCNAPLDLDMRGNFGGFSTAEAARAVAKPTNERPQTDQRGVISFPNYQVVVARRGDTLSDVAIRSGANAAELARFNGIAPDAKLRKGEVIVLPQRVPEPAPGSPGSIDSSTSPPGGISTTPLAPAPGGVGASTAPAAAEPIRHRIARGESAHTVARLYQVPVRSLARWNGLGANLAVREGQYLLIPTAAAVLPRRQPERPEPAPAPVEPQPALQPEPEPEPEPEIQATPLLAAPAAAPARAEPRAPEVSRPGDGSPTPRPPSANTPLPTEEVPTAASTRSGLELGAPSRQSDTAMSMPVVGKIIRDYKKGRNDGIDIAAAPGTTVRAAAGGTVAAITADADKIPIIVLRHDRNLLTVYANVDKVKVAKGQKVGRGQSLASLRGGSDAYLHFEVREGFDSVDPTPYLR